MRRTTVVFLREGGYGEYWVSRTTVVFMGDDAEWWVSRTMILFVGEGEDPEWWVSKDCCICGGGRGRRVIVLYRKRLYWGRGARSCWLLFRSLHSHKSSWATNNKENLRL